MSGPICTPSAPSMNVRPTAQITSRARLTKIVPLGAETLSCAR